MNMIAIENSTTTDEMARPAARARFKPYSVFEYTLDELTGWFRERGEPAYRAKQLYNWVFRNVATDYGQVTVFPAPLRDRLAEELPIQSLTTIHEIATDDGETLKVLYRTADGQTLETVLMFYPDRSTVCVSCQVGCAVGCSFCATGLMGLQRNLSAGEMVAQVVDMARRSTERGRPLTNIVMMGMGEPFHNYDNVMKMVAILNQPEGMHFGSRRITVSTSGVVPFIDKLATEPYQVNLAISIHAANDELRSMMVPLNRRWPLNELIASIRRYISITHRRVSFEYALIAGINDGDEHALQLAKRLKGLLCHVNLIPLNPTPAFPYERPSVERIERFAEIINQAGIPATIRYSRGVEIGAACGQLKTEYEQRRTTPA